jgi:hypothetical protein
MRTLPDVTLVAFGTVCHELMAAAVKDSIRQCNFSDVLVWSDRELNIPGVQTRHTSLPSIHDAQKFWWQFAWRPVNTSHFLVIQWDSWVIDESMWSDEYLKYDYIGAPWWYSDGWNVGNGGFSLRSRRMAEHIARNGHLYPMEHPEDNALCRKHRGRLERKGFRWAPEELASQFSFECVRSSLASRHFGFHAFRNFPFVLDRQALDERLKMADDWALRNGEIDTLRRNMKILEEAKIPFGYHVGEKHPSWERAVA